MIKKEDSTGKNLHDGMKGIGGILSLCTVGKKDLLYRQWITVQSATVSIVKIDRTRNHISTRGLEGRSLERERGDDRRISVHDQLGGRVSVHDRLGAGPCYVIL